MLGTPGAELGAHKILGRVFEFLNHRRKFFARILKILNHSKKRFQIPGFRPKIPALNPLMTSNFTMENLEFRKIFKSK